MYQFIYDQKESFSVRLMCKLLGVSKSSFYDCTNGKSYQPSEERLLLLAAVKRIFYFHRKRYGSLRILEDMKEEGYDIGLYKIRSLMKEQGLKAIQPKQFVPRTTQTDPSLVRSPNLLLDPQNLPKAPNQVIVGDITYLPSEEYGYTQWLYLAVWMDLFSRKIVGWYVDEFMKESLVILAFQQVLRNRNPEPGFIVHSDGGSQYGAANFRTIINANHFRQSMTRKNDHYDNAHIESLFSRFKAEVLDEGIFQGLENARFRTFGFIEGYYNTIRRHSACGQISPNKFEELFWRNYDL